MSDFKTIELRIYGKVQGVWYRASTREKALQLGLSGYVMNKSDGSVVAQATGTENSLEELIDWCHRGPAEAKVEEVKVTKIPLRRFEGFDIRR